MSQEEEKAIKEAYSKRLHKLYDVLCDNLAQAQEEGERLDCVIKFERGWTIAKAARKSALDLIRKKGKSTGADSPSAGKH